MSRTKVEYSDLRWCFKKGVRKQLVMYIWLTFWMNLLHWMHSRAPYRLVSSQKSSGSQSPLETTLSSALEPKKCVSHFRNRFVCFCFCVLHIIIVSFTFPWSWHLRKRLAELMPGRRWQGRLEYQSNWKKLEKSKLLRYCQPWRGLGRRWRRLEKKSRTLLCFAFRLPIWSKEYTYVFL